jgi:hypothetical protein
VDESSVEITFESATIVTDSLRKDLPADFTPETGIIGGWIFVIAPGCQCTRTVVLLYVLTILYYPNAKIPTHSPGDAGILVFGFLGSSKIPGVLMNGGSTVD